MTIAYLDREGNPIRRSDWQMKRADPAYKIVREYDNGAVKVTLSWVGHIKNYGQVFPSFHKLFKLEVMNATSDGQWAPDPVEQERHFPTEEAAVKFYEEFLTQWTGSGINKFGEFQEEGNSLTPPPPPDPDRPAAEPIEPELGGSAW